jgi:hypothetical protein
MLGVAGEEEEECAGREGFFPHQEQCDKYYECKDNMVRNNKSQHYSPSCFKLSSRLCPDGLVYDSSHFKASFQVFFSIELKVPNWFPFSWTPVVLLGSAATHSVLTVLGGSFCSHRVLVRDVQGRKDTFPTAPVINTTSATMEQPTCTLALEGWCLLQTRADAPGLKRQTGRVVSPRISLNFPALRLVQVNILDIRTLQVYKIYIPWLF